MSIEPNGREFLPQTPLEDWQRTLLRAADIISFYGWHKGGSEGRGGAVCIMAAIALAEGRDVIHWATMRGLPPAEKLCRHLVAQGFWQARDCASSFNDMVCSSKEQAISVLMYAAIGRRHFDVCAHVARMPPVFYYQTTPCAISSPIWLDTLNEYEKEIVIAPPAPLELA